MSMIGKTLAHYEITSQLGKGGMGEVYQAKDRKLGRDVAIKVLPEEFARDTDRVARFQREAKLLASLNHPNIAAIYGLEESEGTTFLVLELVEGETLADQLKRGPIPVDESLKLALQIAEALEAAHEKGVIHRDLKPANIKVTPDGKVKVLDFGLAKAFAGEQADLNLSNSPTLSNAATQQGVILGTAAYMSPEQARGKYVDKRADIWAFGCMLFEMLTGQAAFQGEDITEILASVVKGGVNLDLLPANIHPRVREIISRCLQKDLKRRYRDAGDVQFELEQVLGDPSGALAQQIAIVEPRTKLRTIVPWVAAAIFLGAIIAGMAVWKLKPGEPRQVIRFDYELPDGQEFSDLSDYILAVSPDGKQFVYGTTKGLYLRSMDELNAKLISGTDGDARCPFFSPDGKRIGYFSEADQKLKKIAINGGAPVVLCDVAGVNGSASWNEDNTIVYCPYPGSSIMRVSANGGTPESLLKEKSGVFVSPQILPDGKAVLFTDIFTDPSRIMVHSLKSGESKELFAGDTARYLPTGHIVYAVGNDLFAVQFDPDKLEVVGGSAPIVERVFKISPPLYAISDSGTLVYVRGTGSTAAPELTLVWVDRNGKEQPIAATPNDYGSPRISPDGTRVALQFAAGGNEDIWIWNLARKTMTRLTLDKAPDSVPLWTPDGKRIVFSSDRGAGGLGRIYWKAADGTGKEELLSSVPERSMHPYSWSGDGKVFVTMEYITTAANWDIGAVSMEGDHKWKLLLKEKYNELQPQISPNGQWMAYVSDESRKNEIYVRPFPEVDKERWQVSTSGGDSPLWSRDGRELFYRSSDAIMAVSVRTDTTFSLETPRILFRGTYVSLEENAWDISLDGKRFLMIKPPASTGVSPTGAPRPKFNIVFNWFEELKQRVPVK
jgi:serine/threonine protein kinase